MTLTVQTRACTFIFANPSSVVAGRGRGILAFGIKWWSKVCLAQPLLLASVVERMPMLG